MDIQAYIESGILEAYVLDALTPEEKAGVEQHIATYPEMAAEVRLIEDAMLSVAEAGAQAPPPQMKEQIWEAIVQQEKNSHAQEEYRTAGNTRPLPPPSSGKNMDVPAPNWQRAAIWAAFAVSVLTNFILLSQRNESRTQQLAITRQVDSLRQEQQALALAMDNYRKEKDMMADTAMQAVLMKTMQPGHPMAATIYWSRKSGETYLAMQKLPMPPKGKQYQMWVIQDGKPVSMGMIPNDMVSTGKVAKMPMPVTASQAFAISLENEGGNPTPTEVQVLGKV